MEKTGRKPIKNFMIKKSLQARIIFQILFVMVLTGVLASVMVALYYNYKSSAGTFYYMSNNVRQDLELANILSVVLPSLIVAQLVSFVIAFGIGLISSRKVAVPVYKIEKWAQDLAAGRLTSRMLFRDGDNMEDLAECCNGASGFYREILTTVSQSASALEAKGAADPQIKEQVDIIRGALSKVTIQ